MAVNTQGLIAELDWNTGRATRYDTRYYSGIGFPSGFRTIGAAGEGPLFVGLYEFLPSGGVGYRLRKLDPGTLLSASPSVGLGIDSGFDELDVESTSGQLYGLYGYVGPRFLATIHPDTGQFITQIPLVDLPTDAYFSAFAFHENGTPYILDIRGNRLWSIDKTNGEILSTTSIVPSWPHPGTPTWSGGEAGMDFHPQSGTLYVTVARELYTLDPSTGMTSLIGSLGTSLPTFFGSLNEGLAFVEVPEASSFVLLACFFGAVTLTVRRR